MAPVTEQQIKDFVGQLREDLITAERFLSMWKRRNQLDSPIDNASQLTLNGDAPSKFQTTAKIVRDAISRCPPEFNLDHIESAITAMGITDIPRLAVGRCVQRLLAAKRPVLRVVEKGMGRIPAKYALVER